MPRHPPRAWHRRKHRTFYLFAATIAELLPHLQLRAALIAEHRFLPSFSVQYEFIIDSVPAQTKRPPGNRAASSFKGE
jgi:hypothetical protein